MHDPLVPTIDFSPAKATLSEVMTEVFHEHRPRMVCRHGGKEQMLLMRPADLVALLPDEPIEVLAVYDEGEVTLRVPDMGVLGFGDTLEEAVEDLLVELRGYAERFFAEPARFMSTARGKHAGTLLRFALSEEVDRRAMLGIAEPVEANELVPAP